jgi:hypothetical protein
MDAINNAENATAIARMRPVETPRRTGAPPRARDRFGSFSTSGNIFLFLSAHAF